MENNIKNEEVKEEVVETVDDTQNDAVEEVTEVETVDSTDKADEGNEISASGTIDLDKIDPSAIDDLSGGEVKNLSDEDKELAEDNESPDMDDINEELNKEPDVEASLDTPIPVKNGAHAGLVPQKEATEDPVTDADDDDVIDGVNTNMTLQNADREHREIGVDTAPVKEIANIVSSEEEETKAWRNVRRYVLSNQIIYGVVLGTHRYTANKLDENGKEVLDKSNNPIKENKFAVSVMVPAFPDMPVFVKEDEFWTPEDSFGTTYNEVDDERKLNRRANYIDSIIGARIPLVILDAKRLRQPSEDGRAKMQSLYTYIISASRTKAMEILKHIWFFRDDTNRRINTNDVYKANVLRVFENAVFVECCGVETYIRAWDLTSRMNVSNCRELLKPGDCINVKITKVYRHNKGEKIEKRDLDHITFENDGTYPFDYVYLKVSGRAYDTRYASRALNAMSVGDTLMGTVISYNAHKRIYTITLDNHVPASVHEDNLIGSRRLVKGDRVYFKCKQKKESYVKGSCYKESL